MFYEIPYASYNDMDGLPEHPFSLDEPEIKVHHGTLTVDLSKSSMEKGAFKTSHPGMIKLDDETTLSPFRSEEHTSELQSHLNLVCRLLLEKKKKIEESRVTQSSCR